MTRPNFIVIGAMRAGTTALFEYLRAHPEVYIPDLKELNFFWERWNRGIGWYESHFAGVKNEKAIGELSPEYTMYPARRGVAERIAKLLPDVRLIYMMRDPIARMRSNYIWRLAAGSEHRPMKEAFIEDPTYFWMSSYALQIHEYLRFFDRSRLMLVLSEELREKRAETLRDVYGFIGVDQDAMPPNLDSEYNEPRPIMPRTAFRVLGGAIIRTQTFFGKEFVPGRLPPRIRPYISRPIEPEETTIDDDLRNAMASVLRPDVAKLGELMPPGFDGWGLL